MTFELPKPGDPRRPFGPRDPGDAWAVGPTGERYWGRFGAAGLLAVDHERGILLQHRASWSHFGDTWGLPGGARHEGEPARAAALREAAEEAGVPPDLIAPRLLRVLDLGFWTYTTLLGDVTTPFEPAIGDHESHALAWVPVQQVDQRPLHPGFAATWPVLRALLPVRPAIVVDAANVVGAVPDGWWRDRVGAADRLLARLAELADAGVPAGALGLETGQRSGAAPAGAVPGSADVWLPEWVVVLEGQARAAQQAPGLAVVRAPAGGDDAIVEQTERLVAGGRSVVVVTGDHGLTRRVHALGAAARGTGWLRDLLG